MKKLKRSSQPKSDVCPYLNSKDCGFPNKNPLKFCALYKHCTSYVFLEEFKDILEEEKKDGKQDA